MNRIDETFRTLKEKTACGVDALFAAGLSDAGGIVGDLIRAAQDAGADILELGVPFSDPLADGPVIQHATQVALEGGMTLKRSLDMVLDARTHGVNIPLVLMGYYNPILQYDLKTFARDAFECGADGVIVPDLPVEEADELEKALHIRDLHTIFLAAPTSDDERLKKIGKATRGFLYLVSLTGVTGVRDDLPEGLTEFIARARGVTEKPLCVGFGISNAESARRVGMMADGVIVGSALVAKIGEAQTAIKEAHEFVGELSAALAQGK